ncbi:hypothetical protein DXG01_002091 [Tephrocybe rancida]|nr:hypothetical protein DXG01_002091 [Tephrocybe rancida]
MLPALNKLRKGGKQEQAFNKNLNIEMQTIMSFIGICNVNRLPFNVPVLTQCVVCEMADVPRNILSPDVIRQLQAATEEDDPTARVSSYKYDWWKFNKKGEIEVFNMNMVMCCLEHHCNVTGKVAPTYPVAGKYSTDAVINLRNEILAHTTTVLNRVYMTSRRAAGLYMLWQASTKQVQETEDLEHDMDPSWVLLQDVKKLFKAVPQWTNIGSGYDSSLPGPAGDGIYSSLPNSALSSPTPALPFENMSPDISTIPHLTPSAYSLHFRVPPLGPGAFAAPEESAIGPAIAAMFQYIPPDATLSAPLHYHRT